MQYPKGGLGIYLHFGRSFFPLKLEERHGPLPSQGKNTPVCQEERARAERGIETLNQGILKHLYMYISTSKSKGTLSQRGKLTLTGVWKCPSREVGREDMKA